LDLFFLLGCRRPSNHSLGSSWRIHQKGCFDSLFQLAAFVRVSCESLQRANTRSGSMPRGPTPSPPGARPISSDRRFHSSVNPFIKTRPDRYTLRGHG
jgi:hypothetical protein